MNYDVVDELFVSVCYSAALSTDHSSVEFSWLESTVVEFGEGFGRLVTWLGILYTSLGMLVIRLEFGEIGKVT